MRCKFKPYEGKEPYIFVSYSHRDDKIIAPILNRMHDAGFRIWYDKGIEWGTEWPESIAAHLRGSRVCLVFHSASSVASTNCRQEITFAIQNKKEMLPVYLEEAKLSDGLEMQMTLYQAIWYCQYENKEELFEELLAAPVIQECRGPVPGEKQEKEDRKAQSRSAAPAPVVIRSDSRAVEYVEGSASRGHTYYCLGCGQGINADTVLFDMSSLVFGEKSEAREILPFRLTERELHELMRQGNQSGNGMYECSLTFQQIMAYMAGPNNLNAPNAAGLTMEQVEDFVAKERTETKSSIVDLFSSHGNAPERWEAEWPRSILAILERDKSLDSVLLVEEKLRQALRELKAAFYRSDEIRFTMELTGEKDNRDREFVTGMVVTTRNEGRKRLQNRVCPHCGRPVYEHAGAAEHRNVVFLGTMASGKTSVILAMTHYAVNHMQFNMGNPVWGGTESIPGILSLELLEASDDLRRSLIGYEQGIAPLNTSYSRREDLTGATFRIKTKPAGTYKILTLVDLPGELCGMDGRLQTDVIPRKFPAALACDVLVSCVDRTMCEPNPENLSVLRSPVEQLKLVCGWADQFQMMLSECCAKRSVPTMLLYTKCPELESRAPVTSPRAPSGYVRWPKELYMLAQEQLDMKEYPVYRIMSELFSNTGRLDQTFRAEMRCSAYGYSAPTEPMVSELGSSARMPNPRNIELLMRWLLTVTGCIPVERMRKISSVRLSKLADYYMQRPQCRVQNPAWKQGISAEAFARCILFANPGVHDKYFVNECDNGLNCAMYRFRMKPDSNAAE